MKWIAPADHPGWRPRAPVDQPSSERFAAYLLGELPDREAEALEDALFTDGELFEQVQTAEAELFDAYVQGVLDARRRLRFEDRLLASAEGRARLATARALARRAKAARAASARTPFERLRAWFGGGGLLLAAAAAAIMIVIAGVVLSRDRPPDRVLDATLHPLSLRSDVGARRLQLPEGTTAVRLELALGEARTAEAYVAIVFRRGAEIWRSKALEGDELRARVLVPRAVLEPGVHQLRLDLTGEDHRTVAEYRFEVMTVE